MSRRSFRQTRQKISCKIKSLLNRMSLWMQLAFIMTLIISVITCALIYTEYTSTRQTTINNLTETTEKLLTLETKNLGDYLSDLANFCILPCYDLRLIQSIEQQSAFTEAQLAYLKEQMYYYYYTRSDIDDYHIYLLNQELSVGRGVRDQHITSSTCDISELEDIYQTCIESPYYHAVFPAENPSSFFTYYHTMIRVKDKNPQALVKIQVDTSFLNKLLLNHSDHGEIFLILDHNGQLIYSSDTDLLPDDTSLCSVMDSRRQNGRSNETVTLSDSQYLYISPDAAAGGLHLISLIPLSYIDSQIGQIQKSFCIGGLLIGLATIILINLLIHMLTNPLHVLSKQMERTGSGDFHTVVHTDGSREIIELSQSFNLMVSHIDELIRRTYLAELSEKNARLTALESQLNPHFLYNTLQAISTEALLNDQPQINKMITSLASNLRYTIKSEDLVPLRNEMVYVNNYIYLQKIRMDDNLQVNIRIDPDTEEFLIPKISIQTLVENSIIHGISPATGSIQIDISAKRVENYIHICVRDNGNGIPEEQLSLLYADFERQDKTGSTGGIGLVNLYTRLKLLYPQPATLDIRSKPGKYTEILLVLPAMTEKPKQPD